MSIRNLSIRDKLFWLSVLALAFVIAVAATGYWGVEKLQASSHEMRNTFSALRNALEADMMHDAIRGDVLTIFRATSLNDSKPHDDAVQALKDHVTRFNTAIAKNEALPLDSNIKEALVQVKPRLIEYIARGENIAKLAKSDAIAANALYPEFEQSFLKLAVELEKVSDLLTASNDHFVGNANSVAAGASGTLLTVTLISILALLALSILLGRQITRSLAEALGMAERIASGHLDDRSTDARNNDEAGQLIASMNKMRRALFDIVGQVRSGATAVYRATDQINEGNENLSRRTEQQAATLEETAASTEQLAASVRENTSDAREANQRAAHASDAAVRGGQITRDAVKTMAEISDSAKKIAEIISLIEGIAFQTNILALNAAVEAARAGDQGRGFAVVATEVRALAHRSADAAKEIKQLIGESAAKVEGGTALVTQAGQAMEEIISAVQNVTGLISKVADTTEEQSQGIDQVNQSIAQLDGVAQQNAALVEEASAAAESLRDEVHALTQLVDQFKIGAVTQAKSIDLPKPQKAAMSNRPLPPRSLSQKSPPIKQVRAPADSNEDWTEF